MYSFVNDYSEGCHPLILEKMLATNMEQSAGYGLDEHCEKARELIRKACGRNDVDVHFCAGGTQTNLTVINALLRPHQGVYAAAPSHVNTHEAGAIEHTGHKVIIVPDTEGKISADDLAKAYRTYANDPNREHWVQPKMLYISQPTEIGTVYTREELTAIHEVCSKNGLILFIDGARLGYSLACPENDVTLHDLCELADVFYIGGTKCGAFIGEAVVISNNAYKEDFRTLMKQCGTVLAKGRLVGLQYEVLFTDNLYVEICRDAITYARRIRKALLDKGLPFLTSSNTNQQFPIVSNKMLEEISSQFIIAPWEQVDEDHWAIRICTSWATKPEEVDKIIAMIMEL